MENRFQFLFRSVLFSVSVGCLFMGDEGRAQSGNCNCHNWTLLSQVNQVSCSAVPPSFIENWQVCNQSFSGSVTGVCCLEKECWPVPLDTLMISNLYTCQWTRSFRLQSCDAFFRCKDKGSSEFNVWCSKCESEPNDDGKTRETGNCSPTIAAECEMSNGFWDTSTCQCLTTPILIDLDGDGLRLTSAADGVAFDLNADGRLQKVAWTEAASQDAFLVLDRNGNGSIDDGTELFGNVTPQPEGPEKHGFAALAVFDLVENGGDGDGQITAQDAVFSDLRLWIDANHDGRSQAHELHALDSFGIVALDLKVHESERMDRHGNLYRYRAKVFFEGGKWIFAYDVYLAELP